MSASIPAAVLEAGRRHPDRPALAWRDGNERRVRRHAELATEIRRFAAGLAVLGVAPGERVVLLADNSPRWIVADLAILLLGAVDVPRGSDTLPEEIAHIVAHSGARYAIVGEPGLAAHVAGAGLAWIATIEGAGDGLLGWDDVVARGAGRPDPEPAPGRDDLATIVYTSGTTGLPKGVPLTHGNILHNVETVPPLVAVAPEDRFLSILPAWHMYERTIEYVALACGSELFYTSKRHFKRDLAAEAPTFLAAVPRIFEVIYDGFERAVAGSPPFRRALVGALVAHGGRIARARARFRAAWHARGAGPARRLGAALRYHLGTLLSRPFHALAKLLCYRKIVAATGGRLRIIVSGGGALPEHVETFLDAAGLPILVGYGLTETSPVLALRLPECNVLGAMGRLLPHTEVEVRDPKTGKVLPDGEVGTLHFRGPQVFGGYYRDPERTAAVVDARGFFDTGDLGFVTPWGDLRFAGRAKDTIVLRGGENVEPEPLELAIEASPLVAQVVVVGQDQKYLGALVVPDAERLAEEIGGDPFDSAHAVRARERIDEEVRVRLDERRGHKPYERVHCAHLVREPFTIEAGTLTPTLKKRRPRIFEMHRDAIDRMFSGS